MINDRIEVDQFSLGVEVLNVGNAAPATGPLCARLQAWLASLDADQLIARGSRDADDGIEFLEWDRAAGGWFSRRTPCRLTPVPGGRITGGSAVQRRGCIDDQGPRGGGWAAKPKDTVARRAIRDHDRRGRRAPPKIATSTGPVRHAGVRYYENAGPGAPPPAWVRQFDGLWARRHGWHARTRLRSSREYQDHAVDCRIGSPDAVASPRRRPAGQRDLPPATARTARPHPRADPVRRASDNAPRILRTPRRLA